MFITQRNKFFPLPEYELKEDQVSVTIIGKVLDINYATKLARIPDLSLETIILLDKVQKHKPISADEAKLLRSQNLIEGKRPNLYVSSEVADVTGQRLEYMKRRGIDDDYCKKMILDYLSKFSTASRRDFEELLLDKLHDDLTIEQKKSKIKNILQSLKKDGQIVITPGRIWKLKH